MAPGADAGTERPIVVVVGALAPYTHQLYERLAAKLSAPLHVLACSARETSREWELPAAQGYRFEVLPGLRWHRSSVSNLYVNPAVVRRLATLRPAAVVLNDFSPTMLMAALAMRLRRIPYGLRTDGVPETDPGRRSPVHRLMRRALAPGAAFGVAASAGSMRLLASHGLAPDRIRLSPLFPAWRPHAPPPPPETRPYDVLFCGMLNDHVKGARFFTDVVLECLERGRRLSVRVVGSGPLRDEMAARFAAAGVAARFDGFLPQASLEEAYASARLFLFPSRGDVWGIVVNEALQCGASVIASPHSGAAREMLAAEGCGLVLPLDVPTWAAAVSTALDDPVRQYAWRRAAEAALRRRTADDAADAYVSALLPILRADSSESRVPGP